MLWRTNKMNYDTMLEFISSLQSNTISDTYEKPLLDMMESCLVDMVNYRGDGPMSDNVGNLIKTWNP